MTDVQLWALMVGGGWGALLFASTAEAEWHAWRERRKVKRIAIDRVMQYTRRTEDESE